MAGQSPLKVVQLTPPGRGAVATLLVEGPGALGVVQSRFQAASGRPLASYRRERLVFGHFDFGSQRGEEVVVRRRSGESVELHCHGGCAAVAALEKALVEEGCRVVSWQDWAVDHHPDPISAAALAALADARTERTAAILLDQYNGALRQAVEAIRQSLHGDDPATARQQLEAILARAHIGRHLGQPWRAVLAGSPNVGKSSLINALVGYQRAIVHPLPGTTRDVVCAMTAVEGWPVELSDTAGLGAGGQSIERAGMKLARAKLAAADLVILVFDSSRPWLPADRRLVERWPDGLVVHNKCDLPTAPSPSRPPGLWTSALTGQGIQQLVQQIARRLVPDPPSPGAAVPFTPAQIKQLQSAADALAGDDVAAAAAVLGQL